LKLSMIVLVSLLIPTYVLADCDAPSLSFKKHSGVICGFKVTKLYNDEDLKKERKTKDIVIKFGDYQFLMSPKSSKSKPQKVKFDVKSVSKKLLDNFKSGEFYLGSEKQLFSIKDIDAYDLNGDFKADLIFFDVSPGANVYSGVVGIIGKQWVTLIEPTCH
jgi:hypothetical protein